MKAITLIKAARLRTLPLSVAGIITGSALAYRNDPSAFSWQIFAWALLTTILFQVLSNLLTTMAIGVKGTDNEHRLGPQRALSKRSDKSLSAQAGSTHHCRTLYTLSIDPYLFSFWFRKPALYSDIFCIRIVVRSSSYQIYCRKFGLWLSRFRRPFCVRILWIGERSRQWISLLANPPVDYLPACNLYRIVKCSSVESQQYARLRERPAFGQTHFGSENGNFAR